MLNLDDIYHKSKRGHATEKTEAGPHFDMCMSVIGVVGVISNLEILIQKTRIS